MDQIDAGSSCSQLVEVLIALLKHLSILRTARIVFLKLWSENRNPDLRHLKERDIGHYEISNIVLEFFCKCRSRNMPVTGSLLKEKALQIAESWKLMSFMQAMGGFTPL